RSSARPWRCTRTTGSTRQASPARCRKWWASMDLPCERLADLYYRTWLLRRFDENARLLYQQDRIRGTTHTYIGEEAIAVGACAALERDDYITSTHRGHGHCLAKGGDPRAMMAELLGRATGYCKGKGGSMHIADLDLG